ncbi:hypothetical protein BGZ96_011111 [Linnemannia gamsii]|uniref:Uncharacterized protein n=1 Tax=Linnemannia gamsii TaxID=64522 RepID=A0ABQ7JSW0_9FUNG|nr:hypothetical protein BGZ96_011111 [Linnemannia gamsii]
MSRKLVITVGGNIEVIFITPYQCACGVRQSSKRNLHRHIQGIEGRRPCGRIEDILRVKLRTMSTYINKHFSARLLLNTTTSPAVSSALIAPSTPSASLASSAPPVSSASSASFALPVSSASSASSALPAPSVPSASSALPIPSASSTPLGFTQDQFQTIMSRLENMATQDQMQTIMSRLKNLATQDQMQTLIAMISRLEDAIRELHDDISNLITDIDPRRLKSVNLKYKACPRFKAFPVLVNKLIFTSDNVLHQKVLVKIGVPTLEEDIQLAILVLLSSLLILGLTECTSYMDQVRFGSTQISNGRPSGCLWTSTYKRRDPLHRLKKSLVGVDLRFLFLEMNARHCGSLGASVLET